MRRRQQPATAPAWTRQGAARICAVLLSAVVLSTGLPDTATAAPYSGATDNGGNTLRAATMTSPGTPVPVRVSAASGMTTLSWTASSSFAQYRVERATSPSGPFTEIAALSSDPVGFTERSLPTGTDPYGIATGSDGALWFTARSSNQIGRMSTSGAVTWYPIPTANSQPETIVAGPDGALWFTETGGNKIGRISVTGTITEYPVPTAGSVPKGIASGKDGNLYFTGQSSRTVSRISTGGSITNLVTLPSSSANPGAITWGPDDNLWVTNGGTTGLDRVTPGGSYTEFSVPTASSAPAGITVGPAGNILFTEASGNKIGRFSPYFDTFAATEFGLSPGRRPTGISAGPDGNTWFTARDADRIGRITPSGVVTEFAVPTTGSAPTSITAGPDGALWFTQPGANKIGRYSLGPPTTWTDTTAVAGQHYYYRLTAYYNSWSTGSAQTAMSLSMAPSSSTDRTNPGSPAGASVAALARGDNDPYTTTDDWRTNWNLRGVDTRDGIRIWAVGDSGLMVLSTDGGVSWKQQPTVTGQNLARVVFLDNSTGWAVGDGGTILATTDGGTTWAPQSSGTSVNLRDVSFVNATAGWAVGDSGTVLFWNGTSWSAQASGTTQHLRGVAAGSASRVWAVGDRGTVATYDGTGWSFIEINGQTPMYDVGAADATHAWAVGNAGRVIALDGATYRNQNASTPQTLHTVVATGVTSVWAAGGNGEFVRYNGTSWSSPSSGTTATITDLAFANAADGVFVTAGGPPGRTSNGGQTWSVLTKSLDVSFPAAAVPTGAPVSSVRATLVYRASAVPAADTQVTVRASFDGGGTWKTRTLNRPTTAATVTETVDFTADAPSAAALQANGIQLEFRITSGNTFTTTHDMVRVDVN